MAEGGVVGVDPLFVGLTRPAMFLGVSYLFFLANVFIAMVGYIAANNFKFIIVAVPVHLVGYYLCSKEPLFVELFKVRADKCSKCVNRLYHGANSYDPI
jgi:type IV secretion system protein VirB3